jgi:hypothetical protein
MRWDVRSYQPGDEHQILSLFTRVFGLDRSLTHWRWKFLSNPAGHHITLAVSEDGQIIGQFAGLPVQVATPHETFLLSQGIDHMVDPACRRMGMYGTMAVHFFKTFMGPGQAAAWYGYHVPAVYEIEARTFGCETVHPVVALRWDLSQRETWREGTNDRWRSWRHRLARVARFDDSIDRLWTRCLPEFSLAAIRNARYLNWRYADCPDVEYAPIVATDRLTGRVTGMAVIRFGWFDEPVAPLVDWLVPSRDEAVCLSLLGACHDLARARGLTSTMAWFPASTPQHRFLLSLGYRQEATPFLMSVRGHPGESRLGYLKGPWYYTMGDSDIY